MSADHVRLRPVLEDDLVVLDRFLQDPVAAGSHEWFGWSDPWRWRRRWAETGMLDDDGGILMAVRGDEQLGLLAWRKVLTSRTAYCWQIGIGLLPEARGHGYGSKAQRLLVCYLFAHTQVVRIEADTELENVAEQRALEKAGFTREGVARSTSFRNGRWRDCVMYSILRDEVPLHELEGE